MNFKELLSRAKDDDLQAKETLLERYKSLLLKEAIIDGVFDEDLYQELCVTLLDCIRKFRI
jgi:DNA-directed RNA polymerase specialized sigma24 family protein